MLESQIQKIKTCLTSLANYLSENEQAKKDAYLTKLEQTLELTYKFFVKYSKDNITHTYHFYNTNVSKFYLRLNLVEDNCKWKIVSDKNSSNFENIEYITTEQLAEYCWENKMNLVEMIKGLFNYINEFLTKKNEFVIAEKNKYDNEMKIMDEAIANLTELVIAQISDTIKEK